MSSKERESKKMNDRWQHLNDLGKTIITLSSALMILGFGFLKEKFVSEWASCFLSVFYVFLLATIFTSLLSMAKISNLLSKTVEDDPNRAILLSNISFLCFFVAMFAITILGIIELFSVSEVATCLPPVPGSASRPSLAWVVTTHA